MILVGSVSSPRSPSAAADPPRDGEAEPTRLHAIKDPVLRAAFMQAHRAWAEAKAPWLLEEWLA